MAQGCLKFFKYSMCFFNLLCFICGSVVLGFGVYFMITFQMSNLLPTIKDLNAANMLLITGIIITCVSFLGFLGSLKENRCLLMTFFILLFVLMVVELAAACLLLVYEKEIGEWLKKDLEEGIRTVKAGNSTSDWDVLQMTFGCCGVHNASDWGNAMPTSCCPRRDPCTEAIHAYQKSCLNEMKAWFEANLLNTGIAVIVLCIIEVLGMCCSMTLFCHISKAGLGYKF